MKIVLFVIESFIPYMKICEFYKKGPLRDREIRVERAFFNDTNMLSGERIRMGTLVISEFIIIFEKDQLYRTDR